MNHKKICLGFAFLLSISTLSGCTNVKNLSDEESDMIAEFSAGVLLRYSESYPYRLITEEQQKENPEVTETPAPTEVAVPTETPNVPSSSGVSAQENPEDSDEVKAEENTVSLNELYQVKDVEFTYKSYQFCNKYGKGNSLILAEENKSLLVVAFDVKNTSGTNKKVNLMQRNIEYHLNVDGSEYLPGISILENGGLNYLSTMIPKGKTEEAVLIYTVAKEQKQASQISLSIKDGEKKSQIQLR